MCHPERSLSQFIARGAVEGPAICLQPRLPLLYNLHFFYSILWGYVSIRPIRPVSKNSSTSNPKLPAFGYHKITVLSRFEHLVQVGSLRLRRHERGIIFPWYIEIAIHI